MFAEGIEVVAGEDKEFEMVARVDEGGGFQQQVDALDRAEVGHVQEQNFAGEAQFGADFVARACGWARGEEIVDRVDGAVDAQELCVSRLRNSETVVMASEHSRAWRMAGP